MNFREEILKEHSRSQAENIADYIAKNPGSFPMIMDLFFYDEYRVSQRISWPLSILAETNKEFFEPYLKKLILNIKNPNHDAVKRNTTKILLVLEIPEELMGLTIDIMFHLLLDKKEPVAIKANAMTIIHRLCKNEPDLLRELKIIIEDQLPYATPAFTSRAKKILKLK